MSSNTTYQFGIFSQVTTQRVDLANEASAAQLLAVEVVYSKSRYGDDQVELELNRDLFDITQTLVKGLNSEMKKIGQADQAVSELERLCQSEAANGLSLC